MKRFRRFLAFCLAAFVLAACSKDTADSAGPAPEPGLFALRVAVAGPVVSGRTPETYAGTESGYGAENTVSSLHIRFFGVRADGTAVPLGEEHSIESGDLPEFTPTADGGHAAELALLKPYINPIDYAGLRVEVYANYSRAQANGMKIPDNSGKEVQLIRSIGSLQDIWVTENSDPNNPGAHLRPKPFLFTGYAQCALDATDATVPLKRYLSKVRIRVEVDENAVPGSLEIDRSSIRTWVTGASVDARAIDGDAYPNASLGVILPEIDDRSYVMHPQYDDKRAGTVVDSLYIVENMSGITDNYPQHKTTVHLRMTVKEISTGREVEREYSFPLHSSVKTEPEKWRLPRNTIYELQVNLVSIDRAPDIRLDISDWDDVDIDIDAPWGEAVTDRSVLYVAPGAESPVMTVKTGGGADPYSVTLLKADKSGPLDAGLAALRRDDSAVPDNAFLLDPSSEAGISLSTAADFEGAWVKIVRTRNGQPAGLARYIPVGALTFSVPDIEIPVPYSGGEFSVPVTSQATMPDGTTAQLDWTAGFVDGQGAPADRPGWITDITLSGSGGSRFSGTIQSAACENLMKQDGTMGGSTKANAVDLSLLHYGKVGITGRTTANCYIVNGPGWYKLPCIFGNALKNGSPNPSAWTSAAAAGNPDVLYRFVDHTGAGIGEGNGLDGQPMTDQTAPYIYNKYTITDAGLLWQDVEGMVADVSTDGQNITFRVTDKIAYGNAVVVAYAGSDIVWSWHIWATDYDPYAAYDPGTGNGIMSVQNQTGENRTLNFMLQNLGNCPGMKYEARTQHLLLTERASGAALVVKVERQAGKDLHNTPYYQWGRKDPLPGILPDWNNKKIYGAAVATDAWPAMQGSPNILKPSASGTAYISQCIEFPYLFAAVERNDNTKIDNRYYNLWSADNTAADVNTNKVVKTVYDPSPAGFCVPPSGAFTGFTLTGTEATEDVTNINADGDWEQGWGWYFFQNTNKNGNTIHFPTTGFRDQNSRGYSLDIVGYSWLAGPSNNEWPRYTYNFFFNHINTVQPHNYRGGARENALPIRCVQEF